MGARWCRAAYAAVGVLVMGSSAVQAANLPPVQNTGTSEYVSGGIGQDESKAMLAASSEWPLTLEFAEGDGRQADYVADVHVRVRDEAGHSALEADATGPLMLPRLAPGKYTVDASYAGRTLHQRVVIRAGAPARAVFVWPPGADEALS